MIRFFGFLLLVLIVGPVSAASAVYYYRIGYSSELFFPTREQACADYANRMIGKNGSGSYWPGTHIAYHKYNGSYAVIINTSGSHRCRLGYGTPQAGYDYYDIDYRVRCEPNGTAPDTTKPKAQQCPDLPTSCPAGQTISPDRLSCIPAACPAGMARQGSTECTPNKNAGSCKPGKFTYTPNPIHTGTGNKYWSETDYASGSNPQLAFTRQYNSENTAVTGALGTGWQHNYGSTITSGLTVNGTDVVFMARADGTSYSFVPNGSSYVAQDADVMDQLVRLTDAGGNPTGWRYTMAADRSVETYDLSGKLISLANRSGFTQTMMYSNAGTPSTTAPKAGLLIGVADSYRRQITFTYDANGRINVMTARPAMANYVYAYDSNNNLISVTYPDNKIRTYHYNEMDYTSGADLPHALTGITDENGIRYASYYYNGQGQATGSVHAGGVNRYQVSTSSDGSSATVIDPLGTARTTSFTTILGVLKATSQSQPGGSGCGPASAAITYDGNGNISSRTDFNGSVTTYQYDQSRNLETSRVEGAGMNAARTITTEWHPTYALVARKAEPKRITTNQYDTKGNLRSKSVQPTSDADGSQGFGAATVGAARTWLYTYNGFGRILSVTGARTDISDVTRYVYDADGNLTSVTNAAGHVTTLSNYDAHGRVKTIVDPNGMTISLGYSPRGWLTAKNVGGELTRYEYDGVGQLIKVTQPDKSTITYTYDDAHRLIAIADGLGNSISYTLDAMGNRLKEEVKDPSGNLARQTTRVYDGLNRLQQITGGTQ